MRTRHTIYLALAAVGVIAVGVTSTYTQVLNPGKICPSTDHPYFINHIMPIEGDEPTHRATESWAYASREGNVWFLFAGLTSQHPRTSDDLKTDIPPIVDYYDPWDDVRSNIAITIQGSREQNGETCWFRNYILVNDEYIWNDKFSYSGTPPSTKYDYRTTMVHEFGHVLGLHEDDEGSPSTTVMYPYQSPGTMRRVPDERDRNGISMKYGM
jgi:hypothetical protein